MLGKEWDRRSATLAVALAATVAGCQEKRVATCEAMPPVTEYLPRPDLKQESLQLRASAKHCLHAFGYRYAAAPGSTREIADAAMTACAGPISYYLDRLAIQGSPAIAASDDRPRAAAALNTEVGAERRALFEVASMRVVEARAGKCWRR